MSSKCVITGCEFLDVEQKRWMHGDLHQLLDIMIFNGNDQWFDCVVTPMNPEARMVRAEIYYEKRGVLVFPLAICVFNEVAHKYLVNLIRDEQGQIITFGGKLQ